MGFLADKRRINVAVTRARRHLAIVGDSETISSDPTLCSLFKYMEDVGQVWSAHQYIHGKSATGVCYSACLLLDNGCVTGPPHVLHTASERQVSVTLLASC